MRITIFRYVLIVGMFVWVVGASIVPSLVARAEPSGNEASTPYIGRLRVYVVEPISRWKDYDGESYHFGFLDFAFNDDISIDPRGSLQQSITWDGDIREDNVMVIAVLFNSEQHQEYVSPPSGNPFQAYYVDASAAATPGVTGYNTVTTGFTHTVFVEEGTATWCHYCPAMATTLYNIYNSGDYPMYFVAMVDDKNSLASNRLFNEYNIDVYPTAFFDGGYQILQGEQSSETLCRPLIEACGTRTVPPLGLSVSVTSGGGGNLQITVDITNENTVVTKEPENQKPVADLSADEPYQSPLYTAITFNGSKSNDPDGTITNWSWNFGDNTIGTGKIVQHAYFNAGTYNVTLTVTDNEGINDTDTTTCVIKHPNRSPTTPIITGPTNGTKNTFYTYFVTSTDVDNDIIQYTVDWGDSTTQSSGFLQNGINYTVNHSWATPGPHTITIKATDNQTESCSSMIIDINAVEQNPSIPGFELIVVIGAIAVAMLLQRKKRNI